MFRKPVQSATQGDRLGVCVTQLDAKALERGIACTPGYISTVSCALVAARTPPASARLSPARFRRLRPPPPASARLRPPPRPPRAPRPRPRPGVRLAGAAHPLLQDGLQDGSKVPRDRRPRHRHGDGNLLRPARRRRRRGGEAGGRGGEGRGGAQGGAGRTRARGRARAAADQLRRRGRAPLPRGARHGGARTCGARARDAGWAYLGHVTGVC